MIIGDLVQKDTSNEKSAARLRRGRTLESLRQPGFDYGFGIGGNVPAGAYQSPGSAAATCPSTTLTGRSV